MVNDYILGIYGGRYNLAKHYTRVKTITDKSNLSQEKLQ